MIKRWNKHPEYKLHWGTGTRSIPKRREALGLNNYQEYLASPHWREFKKRFFLESKRMKRMKRNLGYVCCEACNSRENLNVHHKTYKRLGNEFLGDVFLLCQPCHKRVHDFYKLHLKKGLHDATNKVMKLIRKEQSYQQVRHFTNKIQLLK